ncbi:MAG: hypothetical protein ACYTFA_15075 [Planctomycetota bacterium]
MPPPRVILRFCIFFALICGVLFTPWPGVKSGYAAVFRAGADIVFRRFWFWSDGHVRFLDLHSPDLVSELDWATPGTLPQGFQPLPALEPRDTLMALMNRSHEGTFGQLRTSSRLLGYWPTAWLVALILAKPMLWSRKGWALVGGLLLVHAFIAVRLSLTLANGGFAAEKAYALFSLSPFWKDVLGRVETVLVTDPTASFVVPTLIWGLVAFKWSEWAALRESLLPSGDADAAT